MRLSSSLIRMTSLMPRPVFRQCSSSSAAVRNGSGSSFLDSVEFLLAASSSPSRTMKPPPTEKKVACARTSPSASETVKVMPLVCRGRTVSGRRTMSFTP